MWARLIEQARQEPIGLALTLESTTACKAARRFLYLLRDQARARGDRSLDDLSFLIRNGCELWIVKRSALPAPAPDDPPVATRPLSADELPARRVNARGPARQPTFLDIPLHSAFRDQTR